MKKVVFVKADHLKHLHRDELIWLASNEEEAQALAERFGIWGIGPCEFLTMSEAEELPEYPLQVH